MNNSIHLLRKVDAVIEAARTLVDNPHHYDLDDGNYKVEGVPFEALKNAVENLDKEYG